MADNGNGDEATASASLTILDEDHLPAAFPRILANPELKAVEKGRNVNLMCSVSGDPAPEVVWLKDFIPIFPADDARISVTTSGENRLLVIQQVNVKGQVRGVGLLYGNTYGQKEEKEC